VQTSSTIPLEQRLFHAIDRHFKVTVVDVVSVVRSLGRCVLGGSDGGLVKRDRTDENFIGITVTSTRRHVSFEVFDLDVTLLLIDFCAFGTAIQLTVECLCRADALQQMWTRRFDRFRS
jgi:hypothetical protein